MSNIRVSYVNFYGDSTNYNNGIKIPMMLRIAGTVLFQEHLGRAKKIGVFVDTTHADNFYDDYNDDENN